MTIALLLDEMFSPAVAEGLRRRGVDAYTIAERSELRSLSDAEVLELAHAETRLVVTFNIKDFLSLHRLWSGTGRVHSGIVLVTWRRFPDQAAAVGPLVMALGGLVQEPSARCPKPGEYRFLS